MKTTLDHITSEIIVPGAARSQPLVINKPRPHIVAARAARQARRANH